MVRDGTAAGAKNVFIEFTGGGEAFLQWRGSTNGGSDSIYGGSGFEAPYYLRVTRTGTGSSSVFRGYVSPDGSSWTEIGNVTVNMPSTVYWGLAVCSHNNTLLNTTVFQNYIATTGSAPAGLMSAAPSSPLQVSKPKTKSAARPLDLTGTPTPFSATKIVLKNVSASDAAASTILAKTKSKSLLK